MITLLLAFTALMVAGIGAGMVVFYVKANRVVNQANELVYQCTSALNNYFYSNNPDQPAPFLQLLEQITEIGAQKIGISTQAAIKGSLGGTMKGVNAALEDEAIAGDPALAVASALPKSLRKNPIAMVGLQMLVNRVMSQGGAAAGPNNGKALAVTNQARFNL